MHSHTKTTPLHKPSSSQHHQGNLLWEELDPMIWRNAIYSPQLAHTSMGKLFIDQVSLFKDLHHRARQKYASCALVEIGFGTAELFSQVRQDYELLIGVEISQEMINCAYYLHPELNCSNVHLFTGNATQLNRILTPRFPTHHSFWDKSTLRIACLCMNTFGILPSHIRGTCLKEMFICVGVGGKLVVGCWHKKALPIGYRQFYAQNPRLCGQCQQQDFDFEKGDFKSSTSDYSSHWWSEDEMEEVLRENFPFEASKLRIEFKIKGIGIFALCDILK